MMMMMTIFLQLVGLFTFLRHASSFLSRCSTSPITNCYQQPQRSYYLTINNNRRQRVLQIKSSVYPTDNNNLNNDADEQTNQLFKRVDVPSPLHLIVDFNAERNSVVYEVSLGREIGLEITPGANGQAVVGQVLAGSHADKIGIMPGDVIVASSATAGSKMWSHASVDGIKSALSTRFVMSASVKIRFERDMNTIPMPVLRLLKIPYNFNVVVRRPIGLHVEEAAGDDKSVIVKRVSPELGAARTRRIEPGDQIVAMSASWGDRMWEVHSVESFVVGVRMRSDPQVCMYVCIVVYSSLI